MRPDVRYARYGPTSLAYQVLGAGPPDILFLPGFVSHLDLAWEEPLLARFLRGLAGIGRLIWFDKRGTGLSDPLTEEPSIDERLDEVTAVLDAAGSREAVVFGVSEGAAVAGLYAARHPERVTRLVLFAGYASLRKDAGTPWGWSDDDIELFLRSVEAVWERGTGIEFAHPSVAGDDRYRAWFVRFLQASASPGAVRRVLRSCFAIDLRPAAASIRSPALVLHRTDESWLSVEFSRHLTKLLPSAELVELPGIDHWPWIGDSDAVLNEIERFVRGPGHRRERPAWGPEALTRREVEVARLAVDGLSAAEVAKHLGIGERTVETHLAHAYLKLGISSKVELARRAAELGL